MNLVTCATCGCSNKAICPYINKQPYLCSKECQDLYIKVQKTIDKVLSEKQQTKLLEDALKGTLPPDITMGESIKSFPTIFYATK